MEISNKNELYSKVFSPNYKRVSSSRDVVKPSSATTSENCYSKENLLFWINFKSESTYLKFKEKIINSLHETFQTHSNIFIMENESNIEAYHVPEDKLFKVDTHPDDGVQAVQVPSYKRTIKEVLDISDNKKQKSDDQCARPRMNKSCFNCGSGKHDLRQCPKPRNMSKINKAKKVHSTKRYHVDNEQRYAHLRPGCISLNLREALGIQNGELPFFFYRLRLLGYPPGWLEDAKVAHSGISLFDSEGRSVRDPDEEPGEIPANYKYDINKIISYPGFNMDPGPNFFDDYDYHNVPPQNPKDSKEEFVKMLGSNIVKGYKRKKLKNPTNDMELSSNIHISDMEIDDNIVMDNVKFTRPPPPSTPPKEEQPPEPPSPPEQQSSSRSKSPPPKTLESHHNDILDPLKYDANDDDDSLIDEVIELEAANNSNSEFSESTAMNDNSLNNTPSNNITNPNNETPQTPVTESLPGTPLLKFSPFDKLPSGDNFKIGVSDVINFENLPDSTGTYEKMKGLIKKVRTIVTQWNSEDT